MKKIYSALALAAAVTLSAGATGVKKIQFPTANSIV